MATTIGTLIIDMAANVAKLQADMNAARGLVTNAAESMVSVAKTATAALGAIGVGLSFGAVVGEFKKAIDTMAELDDAAEMVGASVENVSRLMGVAAESGKSLSDVVAITAKLQSAMIGAEQDTGRASAAFKALGLNLSEFDDSTDALLAFARGLNQYEDGANKTQLAIAVLGKAGAQALPFLKDLANAGELQARVSAEQAAEAERYQKMMARSAYETEQFKISIAANLVPEIFKLIDQFKMARAAGLGLLDALNTIPFAMSKVAQVAESEKRIKALREEMEGLGKVRLFFDPGAEERLAAQLTKEEKRRDVLYAQARAQGEFKTQAEELYGPNGYGERAAKMQAPALADEKKLRDASDAQKKLNDALFEAVGLSKDYYEKLGLMYQLYQSGKLNVDQYRAAVTELTNSQKFHKEAVDKAKEAEKDANAVLAELSKGKLAGAAATTKQIEESDKNLARIIEENSKIGLTREQLVDLNAERELAKARVIDQQIEEKMLVGDLGDEYDALRRVRQGYLDAAEEVRRGGRLQAISEEAKKSKDAWDKQSTDIGNSLTDALLRGFESGKDFGKNFAETLKNLFKTLILKPIIQPIAQNAAGSIMGLLGLGGAGAATAGTGAAAGGTLASGGNLLATLFGGSGGGLGAILGGGSGIGGAATTFATSGLGQLLGLSETVGGVGVGLTGAGSSLVGGLSAIPGWGWALGGAVALAGILGKKRGGPKLGGSFSTTGERLFTPAGADTEAGQLGQSAISGISALAAELGGSASGLSLGIGFDSDPQGTAGNRIASFLRDASGRSIYNNIAGRDVGRDDATLQASLGDETSRLILAGLKAADLPTAVRDFLATVDLSTVTSASMDGVIAEAKRIAAQEASWQPLVSTAEAAAANAMGPQAGTSAGPSGDWYALGPNTANASALDGMGPAGGLSPIAQPLVQIGDAVQILTDPASPLTTAAEATATSTASISRVQEDLLSIAREQRDDQRTIGRAQAEANTSIIEQLTRIRESFDRINAISTLASVRPA